VELWLLEEEVPLVVWLIPVSAKKIAKTDKTTVFIKVFLGFKIIYQRGLEGICMPEFIRLVNLQI